MDRAIEEIMATYEMPLMRYATRLVCDSSAAQDVVQDAFIRLCRKIREGQPPEQGALRNWLYRVTHNCAVDYIRSESRRKEIHEEAGETLKERRADKGFSREQALHKVLGALDRLPEAERHVLVLRLQEGLSYKEISDITGHKVGYVGYLIHHGTKELTDLLSEAGISAEALS